MGERFPTQSDPQDVDAPVTGIDAVFDAGLEALADVTRRDGALDARDKAVLLVAAAAMRDRGAVAAETRRAIGLGVTRAQLRALALALYLSRGAGPCRALLTCTDDMHRPPEPATAATPAAASPPVDEMVEEFRLIFGEIPDRIALLAAHSLRGLAAYHWMRRAVLTTGMLEPAVAELALMCVNASEHRGDFAAVHAAGARRAGATEEQLVEAGLCAISSGGVAAWLAASEAIVSTRPDAPADESAPANPPGSQTRSTSR